MSPFLVHNRAILSSFLALALAAFVSPPAGALDNKQPVIVKLATSNPAAGYGQLVTIQGLNLYDPSRPTLTQVSVTQANLTAPLVVFESPSNPNEVYVRLPILLAEPATLSLKTTDDNLVSAPYQFMVAAAPATPVARNLVAFEAGFPVITSAARGATIGVQAYGTDTSLATAIFTQGNAPPIFVPLQSTSGDAEKGVINWFTVPSTLAPGKVIVQVRVTVNGLDSDTSTAKVLNIQ